jgi:hypothetical protein
MPDHHEVPWAIRSTLISVTDLERSVAFYSSVGPFEVRVRQDDVAVLGNTSPKSFGLILRKTESDFAARHGQQSLGLRFITFDVGSMSELDRIESQLRSSDLFKSRHDIDQGTSQVILGRDPDNLPLVFVYYAEDTLGADYFRAIGDLVYSLDI